MSAGKWRVSALAALLAVVLAACGGGDGAGGGDGPIKIVATTSFLGDVVRNVAGGAVEVEVLVPLGVAPHEFEASSQQVASIDSADLVVAIGLGLEDILQRVLDSAARDGANVLELAPRLDPVPQGPDGASGSLDPHVWMDPLRVADGARLIAAELEKIAPGGGWAERAERYAGVLEDTDRKIAEMLAPIPDESRKLVTNHEVFGYFAARYDLEIVGAVIPGLSTLAEPSSEDLAALVEVIRSEGVRVIFAETSSPARLAEALAAEVGGQVEVVELYTESLGEPGSGADTLVGMLLTNAERIVAALAR